jgi:threonine dehydrogenase-like Zn-dependent dehydrogenase
MQKHDVMGHEFMGIVEDVGSDVKNIQKGDRVVCSFDLGCGQCRFCKDLKLFSCCDITNPSKEMEKLYGHRISGMHGYSHLTGGYEGGQACFARVPFADVNTLKLPKDIPDKHVILLSDVLPTAWWANELGDVGKGDIVAIWGAGPVGQLAAHCAQVRGAKQVILIDCVQYRLDFAKKNMPEVQTINFEKQNVKDALTEMTGDGPDVGIEAVGFHYTKELSSKIQMGLKLETDPSDMLNEIIYCVRKGGRIGVVGVYAAKTNNYNIGAFMEKAMTMRAGQTPVQRYWHQLFQMVKDGILKPQMVITHELPLEKAPQGYKIFNEKEDGVVKIVMHPPGAPVVQESPVAA